MTTELIRRERPGLPSLEKARSLLEKCRSTNECQQIRALAQAVASCAATEQARDDAAAIVLLAKARIGELTADMARVPNAGGRNRVPSGNSIPKRDALAAEGLSRKDAAECEKIAELKKSGDLDRMIKRSGGATTTAAALAVQKLAPADRRKVFAKLGDDIELRAAIKQVSLEANRGAKLEQITKGNRALPTGPFALIYADPPWQYEHVETESRAIENQYPTMPLDEIRALKLPAADDCILFMWATSPKLAEAMSVVDAWHFTYRTCAVWVKNVMGMGYYYRQQHELLLVATRGSIPTPAPADRPSSVIPGDRGRHSEKPAIAAEQIERMYPSFDERHRVELFCRSPRPGWSVWGNQS